jgi:GMP synthase (glutamine-hydrolysing)
MGSSISAFMSHGDSVDREKLSSGFVVSAETESHIAGIANPEKNLFGVQFHPEVTHTEKGFGIIDNFVKKICGCSGDWDVGNYIEEAKKYVQETVGKSDVICFVSGGVDSSLVAAILSQTEDIGTVFPVYIGALMRKNENEEVQASLKKAGINNLIFVDAEERFIEVLRGVNEPEEKRKIIGNFFGGLQSEVVERLGLVGEETFLAQGTLYTDLIESGRGVGNRADNIKSHHNVGCKFIDDLKDAGRIIEPNRLIFKDEARAAAREIGLPPEITEREPFPGPGLGIRIVDCAEESDDWEEINSKVNEIAQEGGLSGCVLPVKTVGVQGDVRTYSYLGMLWGERNWANIRDAAKKIPRRIHSVNRIVYSFEEPKEVIGIKTFVTKENIDLLKEIDYIGREILSENGVKGISQTIFVLFGSGINSEDRSIALRAVSTDDFMTASPFEISWKVLDEIRERISRINGVGSFVIDVTDKPPATTCWE